MDGKAVALEALNSESKKQTWIVMRFPHGMDLNCLTRHPQVHAAARCIMRDRELGRTIETRQVKITASGAFPNYEIDLVVWQILYKAFHPRPDALLEIPRLRAPSKDMLKTIHMCGLRRSTPD